jgi:hypothetical protein
MVSRDVSDSPRFERNTKNFVNIGKLANFLLKRNRKGFETRDTFDAVSKPKEFPFQ